MMAGWCLQMTEETNAISLTSFSEAPVRKGSFTLTVASSAQSYIKLQSCGTSCRKTLKKII